jgi:DNA-binding NarL/FixJ family response regulator
MLVIWLIEDNAAFRRATMRALHSQPGVRELAAFGSCEEALDALQAGKRPNVVLMDIGLPGIDGIEGMRRIKAMAPEVNIVLLTVFEDDEKIFQATCAGASGYLLKSEPVRQVKEAIDQVLADGSPMSPRVARKVLQMFSKLNTAGKAKYGLNEREQSVLKLIVEGLAKKQIADRLLLNPHTVDYVIRCIYDKLHVNCVAAAVSVALKEKLVGD